MSRPKQEDVDMLAMSTSLLLYKFTEGREDWGEVRDVAKHLATLQPSLSSDVGAVVGRRLSEYHERRRKALGE